MEQQATRTVASLSSSSRKENHLTGSLLREGVTTKAFGRRRKFDEAGEEVG